MRVLPGEFAVPSAAPPSISTSLRRQEVYQGDAGVTRPLDFLSSGVPFGVRFTFSKRCRSEQQRSMIPLCNPNPMKMPVFASP